MGAIGIVICYEIYTLKIFVNLVLVFIKPKNCFFSWCRLRDFLDHLCQLMSDVVFN